MLELGQAPRFSGNDFMMTQPQNKQIGQQRDPEGLFKLISAAPHLMLAHPQVRFQISISELYTPSILIQSYHLSRSHIRQISYQEFSIAMAHITPGFESLSDD